MHQLISYLSRPATNDQQLFSLLIQIVNTFSIQLTLASSTNLHQKQDEIEAQLADETMSQEKRNRLARLQGKIQTLLEHADPLQRKPTKSSDTVTFKDLSALPDSEFMSTPIQHFLRDFAGTLLQRANVLHQKILEGEEKAKVSQTLLQKFKQTKPSCLPMESTEPERLYHARWLVDAAFLTFSGFSDLAKKELKSGQKDDTPEIKAFKSPARLKDPVHNLFKHYPHSFQALELFFAVLKEWLQLLDHGHLASKDPVIQMRIERLETLLPLCCNIQSYPPEILYTLANAVQREDMSPEDMSQQTKQIALALEEIKSISSQPKLSPEDLQLLVKKLTELKTTFQETTVDI